MANVYLAGNDFGTGAHSGTAVTGHCPIHGPFTFNLPLDLAGHSVNMHSNAGAGCPKCNRSAPLQEGLFSFAREIAEDIRESNATRKSAERFIRKSKKAKDPELFLDMLEKTDPDLAPIARKIKEGKQTERRLSIEAKIGIAGLILAFAFGLPGAVKDYKEMLSSSQYEAAERAGNELAERNENPSDQKSNDPAQQEAEDNAGKREQRNSDTAWEGVHDT